MWKKLSKILLAAMFFVSGIVLIPTIQAKAVGADTVVKLVGGKAVVRSVAERAGLALSPKQLDNVVSVIERKTYDGDLETIDWVNKANAVVNNPSSTPASKSGFKKYVLDPALWLSGADLIFDAIDAFSDGYNGGTSPSAIPVYSAPYVVPKAIVWDGSTNRFTFDVYLEGLKKTRQFGWIDDSVNMNGQVPKITKVTLASSNNGNDTRVLFDFTYNANGTKTYSESDSFIGFKYVDADSVYNVTPTSDDVADVSNVSSSVVNSFDNDTYNTNTTYNMEIEMPDTVTTNNVNYGDTTIWNTKDNDLEVEIAPPPPPPTDTDGDGIPDSDDDDNGAKAIDVLVRVDDPIPIHEKFFLEMADMGQKIEDMYNGVVHFFDVSIDGFTTLTSGMTGFVSFLDSFFDWLPSEYVALLGSGFTLGVVSFFLRR